MIIITTAAISDAELIADMSRQTFFDTFAKHNTQEDMDKFLSTQFTKKQLIAEVGADGNTFLLAYHNNIPAGYIFIKNNTHHTFPAANNLEICRLYASQAFIGKGIGKALMNAAIDIARSSSKENIWLGVWEHNQRAIDFYTAFGFQKFSEHDFILGDDIQRDWLMNLTL